MLAARSEYFRGFLLSEMRGLLSGMRGGGSQGGVQEIELGDVSAGALRVHHVYMLATFHMPPLPRSQDHVMHRWSPHMCGSIVRYAVRSRYFLCTLACCKKGSHLQAYMQLQLRVKSLHAIATSEKIRIGKKYRQRRLSKLLIYICKILNYYMLMHVFSDI